GGSERRHMSGLRDRGAGLRQVDDPHPPRPGRELLPLLRARTLARRDQPAHPVAAAAGARAGGRGDAPDLRRGPAPRGVRADREGPGARPAGRGHARLRARVALGRGGGVRRGRV
ncbi:MAG: Transcriptional regulator, HxlR family, partial [uncultured Solirubrobacterales bacterium]